jgi:hypothetical protein
MADSAINFTILFKPATKAFKGDLTMAAVFGLVWFRAGKGKGVCKASAITLGSDLDISDKTVRRHLKSLCNNGYLIDLTPDEKQRSKVHDYILSDKGKALIVDKITDNLSLHADNEPDNATIDNGQSVPSNEDHRHFNGQNDPSRSDKGQNASNKGQNVQQKELNKTPSNNLDKPIEGIAENIDPSLNGADAPPPPAIPVATFSDADLPEPGDYPLSQISAWVCYERQWRMLLDREHKGRKRKNVIGHITQRLTKKPKAVEAYREEAQIYPEKTTWDLIDQAIGDDPEDINFWRRVVKYYIGLGWSKTNVVTMIEFYERREIPSKKQEGKVLNGRTDKAGANGGYSRHNQQSEAERNRTINQSDAMDIYFDMGSNCYKRYSTGETVNNYVG